MAKILDDLGLDYKIGFDEAAFYGPKPYPISKRLRKRRYDRYDSDRYALAERYGMVYTGDDGEKKTPYIIHRTSLGCYERTLAYLLEAYAGSLPTWLAPEQVRVLSIKDVLPPMRKAPLINLPRKARVESDFSSNTLGYKIRNGQKESSLHGHYRRERYENNTVSIRYRNGEDLGAMSLKNLPRSSGAIDAKERNEPLLNK